MIANPGGYEVEQYVRPAQRRASGKLDAQCVRCPDSGLDIHRDRCRLHQVARACAGCRTGELLAARSHCRACGTEIHWRSVVALCRTDLLRAMTKFYGAALADTEPCETCGSQEAHASTCRQLKHLPFAAELRLGW